MSHSLLSIAITWIKWEVNQQCYQAPFPTILEVHPSLKRHRHLKDRLNKFRKLPEVLFQGKQGHIMSFRKLTGTMMLVPLMMALTVYREVGWPLRWSRANLMCMLVTQLVLMFSTPLWKVWHLLGTIAHEMLWFVENKFCPVCWIYPLHQCLLFQRNEPQKKKVPFCPIYITRKKYF